MRHSLLSRLRFRFGGRRLALRSILSWRRDSALIRGGRGCLFGALSGLLLWLFLRREVQRSFQSAPCQADYSQHQRHPANHFVHAYSARYQGLFVVYHRR
ncbi:uncharacterized protein EbC_02110 [Erwinia billingiae Eb661]|uniref:Uncharacterized protein n=1 Tax=Erwinia billingiae (strain Eb661) TaxID=634500 RepID=D8MKT6_ERWBE|nr:uncharacterized protein EbC_02110 [Erwinia billingiae Eb661]